MGNDLSSLLFSFPLPHRTAPSAHSRPVPCEISQIGQTVVAYPDRRSARWRGAKWGLGVGVLYRALLHFWANYHVIQSDAVNTILFLVIEWKSSLEVKKSPSCVNITVVPCIENHFPDGIMAGCERTAKEEGERY